MHMNVGLLGLMSLNYVALQGAVLLSIAHAFSSMGLFLFVGLLAGQVGTRSVDSSGIARGKPR